jgi:hypothetical protein
MAAIADDLTKLARRLGSVVRRDEHEAQPPRVEPADDAFRQMVELEAQKVIEEADRLKHSTHVYDQRLHAKRLQQ